MPFWEDPRETKGELLFPQRFPAKVLESFKRPNALGASGYASQHDQQPRPAGGIMFNVGWWNFWKPDGTAPDAVNQRPGGCTTNRIRAAMPQLGVRTIISVDANFKDSKTADPVAIHVYGCVGADKFLLHRVHGPFGFNKTLVALRECVAHATRSWGRPDKILIEAKANGDAIIESLRSEFEGVIGVNPVGGKEARAAAGQPLVEAGNVYLPDGVAWLDYLIDEFAAFPKGKHDDDVDAWSQAMHELNHGLRRPRRF